MRQVIQQKLNQESRYFLEGVKNTKFRGITKKKFILELLANGIAAIVASGVYALLKMFFKVKTPFDKIAEKVKVLKIFQKDSNKILVEEETFNYIGWILIFFISLYVFTIVEQVMENYFKARENKTLEEY